MKKLYAIAAVVLSSASAMAFQLGQTPQQVTSEVAQRMKNGESADVIAAAAAAARIPTAVLVSSMILSGIPSSVVVAALVTARFNAVDVVNAAVNNGGNRATLNSIAIANGAPPGSLLPATAAGPVIAAQSVPFSQNITGFNTSPAPTFSGGGRGRVSGS